MYVCFLMLVRDEVELLNGLFLIKFVNIFDYHLSCGNIYFYSSVLTC